MKNNLDALVLAFLAARCPAAYKVDHITARVNQSGWLREWASEDGVSDALKVLLRNGHVYSEVEPVGTDIYWNATKNGVEAWHRTGRLHVGG